MRKFPNAAFLFLLLLSTTQLLAQLPGGGGGRASGQNMNMGHFYGKVLDATASKPIYAASVQLLQEKLQSRRKEAGEFARTQLVVSKMRVGLVECGAEFAEHGVAREPEPRHVAKIVVRGPDVAGIARNQVFQTFRQSDAGI